MKSKIALIIFLVIFSINFTHATEQIPDLLIIENDTICLKSFPLEDLKFQIRPFKYGDYYFPSTACWRGYQAIWKVVDGKLFLVEIIKADSTKEKLDLEKYFKTNNYSPKIINGLIYADWYSADLEPYPRNWEKGKVCIFKSYKPKKSKLLFRFEYGILTVNNYDRRK
jgi:hypothetical protein